MTEFKSYSQYGEDTVLKDILGNNGYFLEIGSYHPTIFSNTRFLVERGWEGCYVDGSPCALTNFIKEYWNNDKITLVNCLIGAENRLVEFYDSIGDGISSTDHEHISKWKASGSNFKKIISPIITFNTLYQELPKQPDFINIDVEGQSASLAMSIDYSNLTAKVICIEHDNRVGELNSYFLNFNFKLAFNNHTNCIFVKS